MESNIPSLLMFSLDLTILQILQNICDPTSLRRYRPVNNLRNMWYTGKRDDLSSENMFRTEDSKSLGFSRGQGTVIARQP